MAESSRDAAHGAGTDRSIFEATGFLDTAAEQTLDRFTHLASAVLHAPVAQLGGITQDRQGTKGQVGAMGLHPSGSPHALVLPALFELPELVAEDARQHPRV